VVADYTPANLAEILEKYTRKRGFFLQQVRTPVAAYGSEMRWI
jgi:hypothetical protein